MAKQLMMVAMVAMLAVAVSGTVDADQIDIAAAGVNRRRDGYDAVDVVNGVGLTGDNHSTSDQYAEWMGENNVSGAFFVIDLKTNHALDATTSLKFWNGKKQSNSGFKTVKFYLSDDFQTWVETPATIKNSGGTPVSVMPQSTGSGIDGTVDFGAGVTARYIKIQVDGGAGTGNWGHTTRTCLAEIQAFGTPTGNDPVLSDPIAAVTATASSSHGSGNVVKAVDGTGLTGTGDQHRGYYSYGWVATDTTPVWMTVDLGAGVTQQIQGMKIWNQAGKTALGTADAKEPGRGLRMVNIEVSNDNSAWTPVFDDPIEIPMGDDSTDTGSDFYDSPLVLDTRTAISGVWRYVRIANVSGSTGYWGGLNNRLGLAEVQLFETYTVAAPGGAIPEPAGLGIAGLILVTLKRRRR